MFKKEERFLKEKNNCWKDFYQTVLHFTSGLYVTIWKHTYCLLSFKEV